MPSICVNSRAAQIAIRTSATQGPGPGAEVQGRRPQVAQPEPENHAQLQQAQAAEEQVQAERVQSLRQERLPRILQAMEVKISQLTQQSKGDLPARAVVDIQDPKLGRLRMELSVKESKVSIHLQHATPEVQAMLEGSQTDLKDHLARQGLDLGGFSSDGGQDQDSGRQGGEGRRDGRHEHFAGDEPNDAPAPRTRPRHDGFLDTVI